MRLLTSIPTKKLQWLLFAWFFLFPFLPCGNHILTGCVVHHNCTRFRFAKALCLHLPPVDKRTCQPVGKIGAEFFHNIKRQTWSAGPVAVQKPCGRVKAATFESASHIVREQRIQKRKKAVDGIKRWTTVAAIK